MRHPTLAMVGLAVIALLCVQLLRSAVTLEVAAQRALLVVAVLAVVDRVAVPIGRAMLGAGRKDEPAGLDGDLGASAESDEVDGRVS